MGLDTGECIARDLKETKETDTLSADKVSPYNIFDPNDWMSKFERNLRELIPDLHGGNDSTASEQPKGTRRSERLKKPSSRFNAGASRVTWLGHRSWPKRK